MLKVRNKSSVETMILSLSSTVAVIFLVIVKDLYYSKGLKGTFFIYIYEVAYFTYKFLQVHIVSVVMPELMIIINQ